MNTHDDNAPIKVTFYAMPRVVRAMEVTADLAKISRTDVLNRAVQVYAALIGLGPWAALRLLLAERATLRQFAAEPRAEVVHLIRDGSATTRCCSRTPFELPPEERMTRDPAAATCGITADVAP